MLRKLAKKDVGRMLEWMHDPEVSSCFRTDFTKMTKKDVENFIENSFTKDDVNFAFVDENDNYLGTISLKHISKVDKNAEYAIVTHRDAQGTGAAFRATMDILKYAFEELGLHRVYLNVLEDNIRANKFYEKCRFNYEGKFIDHFFLRGKYHNLNWYGITKKQFEYLDKH